MGKVVVAAAAVLAIILGGYFVAVRINPTLAGGDVAVQTPAPEDEGSEEGVVEYTQELAVDGTVTALSGEAEPGAYLLRVMGEGYLPIVVDDSLGPPGLGESPVIAVPADFEASDDRSELFAQLSALADETGEPFRVIRFAG